MISTSQRKAKCRCDYYAPSERERRSNAYNKELATFYVDLKMSGEETIEWVLEQLYDRHCGRLFEHDGRLLDVRNDAALMDRALRFEDERRTMNRYKARATSQGKYRLQKRLVPFVTMLGFARAIHLCVTSGACSKR